jgi:hypothetical protein
MTPSPCPFCGAPAEIVYRGPRFSSRLWRVGCDDTTCIGRQVMYGNFGWTTETEVIAAWNLRGPNHRAELAERQVAVLTRELSRCERRLKGDGS